MELTSYNFLCLVPFRCAEDRTCSPELIHGGAAFACSCVCCPLVLPVKNHFSNSFLARLYCCYRCHGILGSRSISTTVVTGKKYEVSSYCTLNASIMDPTVRFSLFQAPHSTSAVQDVKQSMMNLRVHLTRVEHEDGRSFRFSFSTVPSTVPDHLHSQINRKNESNSRKPCEDWTRRRFFFSRFQGL